jgi:hypothetical protein
MRNNIEETLQAAIWAHIRFRGNPNAIAFAVPNGEYRSKRTGGRLKAQGVVPGIPDLAFTLPDGRSAYMELKRLGGRLLPEQRAFADKCARMGVEYCTCYDIDTAISVLEAWQIIKPEAT